MKKGPEVGSRREEKGGEGEGKKREVRERGKASIRVPIKS